MTRYPGDPGAFPGRRIAARGHCKREITIAPGGIGPGWMLPGRGIWRRLPSDFARGSRTNWRTRRASDPIDVLASDPIDVQLQLRARYVWQGSKGAARACLTILTGGTCAVVQLVQLDRVNTHKNDHSAKKRPT